jgi:hypothetical protein
MVKSKPLHLEVQAILIRSFEDNPVAVPFQIAFADDYVPVGILLCGVHGVSPVVGSVIGNRESAPRGCAQAVVN